MMLQSATPITSSPLPLQKLIEHEQIEQM